MWTEVAAGGSFIGFVSLILRWQQTKISKMEADRKKELYQPNGQTNYMPRAECMTIQTNFCKKIDEVKALIIDMDKKREEAKDAYHNEQQRIVERLAGIEAKLHENRHP